MGVKDRAVIGVTMGDPAGVGPEIAVKALSKPGICDICKPVLIGDLKVLKNTAEELGIGVTFETLDSAIDRSKTLGESALIKVLDLNNVDVDALRIGKISSEAGKASIEYVEKAVEYALSGEVDAIATGPINKKAIQLAGSHHIGHTEMLAALCRVEDPLMMFWVRGARIFFLTRHLPLVDAIKAVKRDRILRTVFRMVRELRRIGVQDPSIVVAALNPHASDEDLVGEEETKEIIPAIKELQANGVRVVGPVPADSVFLKALEERYDAVLSLYHDQGHIAAKTVDFYGTVSVTLGLPFIRTSVDHGTAYDIAGEGRANPRSLEEAIKLAARLVRSVQ